MMLATDSGDDAAANRAAEVPTSGATTAGVPSPHSAMSRSRKAPIADGESRSAPRSDWPTPGRSTAHRRNLPASDDQIGANANTLSGHGLVSTMVESAGPSLSAMRTRT